MKWILALGRRALVRYRPIMSDVTTVDIVIIGAGIAGSGVAAMLSGRKRVTLLEAEPQPGFHSTSRSAAIYIAGYGNAVVRALTRTSAPDFEQPPAEWTSSTLLTARGMLVVAGVDETEIFAQELAAGEGLQQISAQDAVDLVPILRRELIDAAAFDISARDINIDALHQGWLRLIKRQGGEIATLAPVSAIHREATGWLIEAGNRRIRANVVVNAAGAWADRIGALAGVAPIGLKPLRRSIAVLSAPDGIDITRWPLFGNASETWYAKPDVGKLLISPADEDPVEPHDAYADDIVLAEGLDRFERATTYQVTRVERSWAGLRTFTPDRTPVVGFDCHAGGFFWLAGQGGYGIQTAPALARLSAALILGEVHGLPLDKQTVASLSPDRFGRSALD